MQRNHPPARDRGHGSLLFAIGLFPVCIAQSRAGVRDRGYFEPVPARLDALQFRHRQGGERKALPVPGWRYGRGDRIVAWFSLAAQSYAPGCWRRTWCSWAVHLYGDRLSAGKNGEGKPHVPVPRLLFVLLIVANAWRVAGGVFDLTFVLADAAAFVVIATSLISFPMITVLLTLHTSQPGCRKKSR